MRNYDIESISYDIFCSVVWAEINPYRIALYNIYRVSYDIDNYGQRSNQLCLLHIILLFFCLPKLTIDDINKVYVKLSFRKVPRKKPMCIAWLGQLLFG